MDDRIYAGKYLGDYATRRYPKGRGPIVEPAIPGGGTPLGANPLTVTPVYYQGFIAPHSNTERWRYIVPRNRRAKIETLLINSRRAVAAGAVATCRSRISLIRDKSTIQIDLAFVQFLDNVVGITRQCLNPGPLELFEGDQLLAETSDGSTGGSCDYMLQAAIVEFDAIINIGGNLDLGSQNLSAPGQQIVGGDPFKNLAPFNYPPVRGGQV